MRIVPAANGWRWLTRGSGLFIRRPFTWLAMTVAFILAGSALGNIAFIGRFLVIAMVPVVLVMFVGMSEVFASNGKRSLALLAGQVRQRAGALATLGASYYVLIGAAFGVTALADGGTLATSFMFSSRLDPELFKDDKVRLAGQIALFTLTPVAMAYWFSPMLVVWHGMSPGKALFYSFFASTRNWRAGSVYTLGLLLFLTVGGVAVLLVATLASPKAGASAMTLLSLLLVILVFATVHPSYVDIFPGDWDEASAGKPAVQDDAPKGPGG